jgi:F420-0:gamma-glutamyl ligase
MSFSRTTSEPTRKDTVLVPIEYIRVANQVFVERDMLAKELAIHKKLQGTNVVIISASDSVISKLERKVTNLEAIIVNKDMIKQLELKEKDMQLEKARKQLIRMGIVSGAFMLLLVIL